MSKLYMEFVFDLQLPGGPVCGGIIRLREITYDYEATERDEGMKLNRMEWPTYAWPGGYPLYYLTKDCGVLCPKCANDHLARTLDPDDDQFFVVAQEVNWEDQDMHCDHCGAHIKPAYGGDDADS